MKKKLKILFSAIMFIIIPFVIVISLFIIIKNNFILTLNCNKNVISKTFASVERVRYAKVKENCYLFKTSDVSDASFRNVEFIIPESYFVIILNNVNSSIFKVRYNNKIGYVSGDSIKEVDFLPVNPFLENITFDINDSVGTQLRKTPTIDDDSNVLMVIPAGTKSISYIASTVGTVPTGGSSNIWYYATFSPATDPTSVYEGFVYSGKTVNLSNIPLNVEGADEIINNVEEELTEKYQLNGTIKTILVVVICLPIILIFILLLVGNKKKNKKVINEDNIGFEKSENDMYNKKTSIKKKLNKIDDFSGKEFKQKKPFYTKFITEENSANENIFPVYDSSEDDDLL